MIKNICILSLLLSLLWLPCTGLAAEITNQELTRLEQIFEQLEVNNNEQSQRLERASSLLQTSETQINLLNEKLKQAEQSINQAQNSLAKANQSLNRYEKEVNKIKWQRNICLWAAVVLAAKK